jgi:ketosteroid isomerase-like protein
MDNLELVKNMYAAFTRGDIGFILDRFGSLETADVVSDAAKRAPWHFKFAGRDGAKKYFDTLLGTLEPVRLEFSNLAAVGDWVYATVYQEHKVRATGKLLVMRDGVHRFRIRDGRVLEWHANEDTALSSEVLGL